MKKKLLILLATLSIISITITIIPSPVIAQSMQELDGATLVERAKTLNGQKISFQGEVVGDIMPRHDGYWINVLNNGTAIGVWITDEQRSTIQLAGQFGVQGDVVKIIGHFNQACSEHGGDLDIHAQSLSVINYGSVGPFTLDKFRLVLAISLFIFAMISLLILIKQFKPGRR